MFYELILPYVKLKINEFKLEEIYSILLSASRPLVKKRSVCRELIEVGITALPLLQNDVYKIPLDQKEKMIFQYFRTLMNFIFKEEQRILIEDNFKKMNVDIQTICVKYGYLIPQKINPQLNEEEGENEKNDESIDQKKIGNKENE